MQRDLDLVRRRLVSTGLAVPSDANPAAAVRRLGCAQGQDLPGVIASLALRAPGSTAADVTAAMDRGEIVRAYPMRGTVFAVHADDVAWMGELLRPKFEAELARRRASQGVTAEDVELVTRTTLEALEAHPDGLTREQLGQRWTQAGIDVTSARRYHFISTLMIEGHMVYGPWDADARDQRVVAASTWLPADGTLHARFDGERIPAIAEWLRRYLTSHGPATLRDFAWWTKLGLGEIRKAAPSATEGLIETEVDGEPAWHAPEAEDHAALMKAADRAMLLPGFDELVLGYADRGYLLTKAEHDAAVPGNNGVFRGLALDRARPLGTWRRAGSGAKRKLELAPFDGGPRIPKRAHADFERRFADHPWLAP